MLLTNSFPKLQHVLNSKSLGGPLGLQGIADWRPILAGLSFDQVYSMHIVQISVLEGCIEKDAEAMVIIIQIA